MRRIGNCFEAVVEPENLQLAFWKASQGKRHRPEQRAFAENLSAELAQMRAGLLAGDYPVGNYTLFTRSTTRRNAKSAQRRFPNGCCTMR